MKNMMFKHLSGKFLSNQIIVNFLKSKVKPGILALLLSFQLFAQELAHFDDNQVTQVRAALSPYIEDLKINKYRTDWDAVAILAAANDWLKFPSTVPDYITNLYTYDNSYGNSIQEFVARLTTGILRGHGFKLGVVEVELGKDISNDEMKLYQKSVIDIAQNISTDEMLVDNVRSSATDKTYLNKHVSEFNKLFAEQKKPIHISFDALKQKASNGFQPYFLSDEILTKDESEKLLSSLKFDDDDDGYTVDCIKHITNKAILINAIESIKDIADEDPRHRLAEAWGDLAYVKDNRIIDLAIHKVKELKTPEEKTKLLNFIRLANILKQEFKDQAIKEISNLDNLEEMEQFVEIYTFLSHTYLSGILQTGILQKAKADVEKANTIKQKLDAAEAWCKVSNIENVELFNIAYKEIEKADLGAKLNAVMPWVRLSSISKLRLEARISRIIVDVSKAKEGDDRIELAGALRLISDNIGLDRAQHYEDAYNAVMGADVGKKYTIANKFI